MGRVASAPSFELDTKEEAWDLGCAINTRGDFNGDGVNDIAVGAYRGAAHAPKLRGGGASLVQGQGSAYVWSGGKSIPSSPSQILRPPQRGRRSSPIRTQPHWLAQPWLER